MSEDRPSIATLAHRRAKLTKREAFTVLKKVIKTEGLASDDDLAGLYSFFLCAPVKSKYADDNFAWCTQAMTNEDPKFDMRFPKVEAGVCYTTDGNRLFYAHVPMEDGFYDVAGSKVEDKRFPKVNGIIKSAEKDCRDVAEWPFKVSTRIEHDKVYHSYNIGGVHIKTRYLDEALAGLETEEFTIRASVEARMVRVNNHAHDRVAIIMGLRVDAEDFDNDNQD